jgi:hypothetical protein
MALETAPWHAAFPKPQSTAQTISRSEVLARLKGGEVPGRDFLLVDLRRNDHEVRRIRENECRLILMYESGRLTCLLSSSRVVRFVAR